jgi:syntaxin 1B/2/3
VRRDKASSVAHEVEQRHKEIQDIEKQTEMITELFESVDQIVSQQARVVLDIEEKSEEVKGDTVKATMECGKAIKSARSRNRKKCWCALIVMLIITSIIIVAVIVVTQKAKRA